MNLFSSINFQTEKIHFCTIIRKFVTIIFFQVRALTMYRVFKMQQKRIINRKPLIITLKFLLISPGQSTFLLIIQECTINLAVSHLALPLIQLYTFWVIRIFCAAKKFLQISSSQQSMMNMRPFIFTFHTLQRTRMQKQHLHNWHYPTRC